MGSRYALAPSSLGVNIPSKLCPKGSLLRKAQVKIGVPVFLGTTWKVHFFSGNCIADFRGFKLMEMNVATAVFQVVKNWDLDVFGCIW